METLTSCYAISYVARYLTQFYYIWFQLATDCQCRATLPICRIVPRIFYLPFIYLFTIYVESMSRIIMFQLPDHQMM
jgi:hypothetical protein